jgi:hypothetical protein
MASEPQSKVQLRTVPFNTIVLDEQAWGDPSEEPVELGLLAVPRGANFRIELLRVGYMAQLAVAGTTATVDIEFQDSLLTGPALVTAAKRFDLTNVVTDRVFDADTAVEQEVANVLGTFVADLQAGPSLPTYTISSLTIDRVLDVNSTSDAELADVLGTLIGDVLTGSLPYYSILDAAGAFTNFDRSTDISGPPANAEFADILATLIVDLRPRTDLVATVNLANALIQDYNAIWSGRQILEAGDSVNAEFTIDNITTGGEGYSMMIEYRVIHHSGG